MCPRAEADNHRKSIPVEVRFVTEVTSGELRLVLSTASEELATSESGGSGPRSGSPCCMY